MNQLEMIYSLSFVFVFFLRQDFPFCFYLSEGFVFASRFSFLCAGEMMSGNLCVPLAVAQLGSPYFGQR